MSEKSIKELVREFFDLKVKAGDVQSYEETTEGLFIASEGEMSVMIIVSGETIAVLDLVTETKNFDSAATHSKEVLLIALENIKKSLADKSDA